MIQSQHLRRNRLCITTIIAYPYYRLVNSYTMFQQRILISIISVFGYLQLHRTAIESYSPTTSLYQMSNGIISTHIVIHHHSACVHACTDTVIKHDGDTCVDKFLIMIVVTSILCLRHNHTTHLRAMEIFAYPCLPLIFFVTQRHHHIKSPCSSCLHYTGKDGREIIVGQFRHYHSYHLLGHHPAVSQSLTQCIRIKIMFACVRLNSLPALFTDTW